MTISRGNKADLGNNGGTTNSLTAAYTVNASSNWLFVGFLGDVTTGNDDITGVTYNSVSLSLVAKKTTGLGTGDRFLYLYGLQNPTAGASHNVVISCTNNHYLLGLAIDYIGVGSLGTAAQGSIAYPISGASTTLTVNTAVTVAGSWDLWLQGMVDNNGGVGGGWGTMTSTNLTFEQSQSASGFSEPNFWDSNGTVSTGTFGANNTGSQTSTNNVSIYAISVALQPPVSVSDVDNLPVGASWLAGANPNGAIMFIANQAMTITALEGIVVTAAGAAATVSVNKVSGGVSTVIHSGSFNANGTALALQTLTLTVTALAAGDFLQLSSTGAFTASAANLTVFVQ